MFVFKKKPPLQDGPKGRGYTLCIYYNTGFTSNVCFKAMFIENFQATNIPKIRTFVNEIAEKIYY